MEMMKRMTKRVKQNQYKVLFMKQGFYRKYNKSL